MLQFYLKNHGIELSWTGTGRLIMSFSFSDEDFNQVVECFVSAAQQMLQDAWWWQSPQLSNKAIKRQFLSDLLTAKFPSIAGLLPRPLVAYQGAQSASSKLNEANNLSKAG